MSSADAFKMCLNADQDRRKFSLVWVQTVLKVTSRPLKMSFYLGHHCLLIYSFMGFPVHRGLRVKG